MVNYATNLEITKFQKDLLTWTLTLNYYMLLMLL
jgi:hypothetical protein